MWRISLRQPVFAAFSLRLIAALSGKVTAGEACSPDKLGVARTLALSTKGGFAVGLESYPQSLDLADHEVVLTFDDGPSPKTTPAVLAALAHECVKATFFLIGRNAEANPALVRRELSDGHTIGHHSYSHPILRLMTDAAARGNIEEGFAADDKAAYGKVEAQPKVPFFRFPGFADTPALVAWLKGRDIGVFGADLWASDWLKMTPEAERKLILARLAAAGRGILLLHEHQGVDGGDAARLAARPEDPWVQDRCHRAWRYETRVAQSSARLDIGNRGDTCQGTSKFGSARQEGDQPRCRPPAGIGRVIRDANLLAPFRTC